jgi:hypothetical protein
VKWCSRSGAAVSCRCSGQRRVASSNLPVLAAATVARAGAAGVVLLHHVAARRALALKVAMVGAVGVVVLCCGFGYLVAGIVAGIVAGTGIAGEGPVVYPFAAGSAT